MFTVAPSAPLKSTRRRHSSVSPERLDTVTTCSTQRPPAEPPSQNQGWALLFNVYCHSPVEVFRTSESETFCSVVWPAICATALPATSS
jgi:hypothetical protein